MKKMTLMVALRDFFGYQPGQKLSEFTVEMKAAIEKPADRQFYVDGLQANGYEIVQAT